MFAPAVSDLWWKNAVVYCLDVETYMDGDGDGVGDFTGLTQRLPYLAGLGITCVWLLPFYATPNRDDGYDVSDYYAVDPRLGTLGEFVEFVRTARELGIRVVVDLVEESSNWEYDEQAGQYYLHRFYSSQPEPRHPRAAQRPQPDAVVGPGQRGLLRAAADQLVRPVVEDGPFGYREVNVAAQRRREDALLNRLERAIRVRKECPEFGWGAWSVVDTGDSRVLAHRCDWLEGTVLAVHNFCAEDVDVRLDLRDGQEFEDLTDVFGNQRYEPLDAQDVAFSIPPYSYRWLRARRPGSPLPL